MDTTKLKRTGMRKIAGMSIRFDYDWLLIKHIAISKGLNIKSLGKRCRYVREYNAMRRQFEMDKRYIQEKYGLTDMDVSDAQFNPYHRRVRSGLRQEFHMY